MKITLTFRTLALPKFLILLGIFSSIAASTQARTFGNRPSLVSLPRGGQSSFSARTPVKTVPNHNQGSQNKVSSSSTSDRDRDEERVKTKEVVDAFLTRDSRNTFIARVYAILAGQLLVTAGSVVLFGTQPALRRLSLDAGRAVPTLSLLLSTVAWGLICTSTEARRRSPLKWYLLSLFTLGEAVTVGFISSFYAYRSVLSAMLSTAIATASVSLYTALQKQPKYDLSQWGAGLSSCLMIFLAYALIGLFQTLGWIPTILPYNDAIFSFFGACLFSFYLAHDTRLIVSGKHSKYQMNEKDYVFGACSLYVDIVNIFIYILRMIGEDRD